MRTYSILSMRDVLPSAAQGCLNEFEDVLVESCGGSLLLPRPRPGGERRLLGRRIGRPFEVEVPPGRPPSERVLIAVALSMASVPDLLRSLPSLRPRFDVVAVYIFEGFNPGRGWGRSGLREKVRAATGYYGKNIDMIFVSMSSSVGPLSEFFGVPARFVPAACDVLRFGSDRAERMIDVNGYGRQDPAVSRALARRFNHPSSGRFYYHTGDSAVALVPRAEAQRQLFWKLLTRSRIGLAYDPVKANPHGIFPFSFIALRWFEMITAGCLIAGRRPDCPEMDELFSWDDSTVEVPEDPEEAVEFLEDLLEDSDRIDAARRRNHEHALARHDWRHRIATMLDALGLPHPEPLRKGLEALDASIPAGVSPRPPGRARAAIH